MKRILKTKLSGHAVKRCGKRGIPLHQVDIIMKYGAVIGGNKEALYVTVNNKQANKIINDLKQLLKYIEKSKNKVLIVSKTQHQVITAFYDEGMMLRTSKQTEYGRNTGESE